MVLYMELNWLPAPQFAELVKSRRPVPGAPFACLGLTDVPSASFCLRAVVHRLM